MSDGGWTCQPTIAKKNYFVYSKFFSQILTISRSTRLSRCARQKCIYVLERVDISLTILCSTWLFKLNCMSLYKMQSPERQYDVTVMFVLQCSREFEVEAAVGARRGLTTTETSYARLFCALPSVFMSHVNLGNLFFSINYSVVLNNFASTASMQSHHAINTYLRLSAKAAICSSLKAVLARMHIHFTKIHGYDIVCTRLVVTQTASMHQAAAISQGAMFNKNRHFTNKRFLTKIGKTY